jgi:hypothetical protein
LKPANLDDFMLYLRRCAGVGSFLIGSLKLPHADGLQSCRIRGRSLGHDAEGKPRILLAFVPPEERFSILTHKIDELSQEVRKRRRI